MDVRRKSRTKMREEKRAKPKPAWRVNGGEWLLVRLICQQNDIDTALFYLFVMLHMGRNETEAQSYPFSHLALQYFRFNIFINSRLVFRVVRNCAAVHTQPHNAWPADRKSHLIANGLRLREHLIAFQIALHTHSHTSGYRPDKR